MLKVLTKGCEQTRGSKYSAAVDLYASEDCIIAAGETKIIGLGVCIDMSDRVKNQMVGEWIIEHPNTFTDYDEVFDTVMSSHYLELRPRSSLIEKGLISNTRIIYLDFKDEIKIIIHNPITSENLTSDDNKYIKDAFVYTEYKISKGDKIAQILLKEHKGYLLGVESDEERTGGFGSTGK